MRALLFNLLYLILCGHPPLGSTTLQAYGLDELVDHAAQIVVGTCQSAQTELVEGKVYTRYQFTVQEALKGDSITRLSLCLPGGQYQGEQVHLAGMPSFAPGEEAVLFLTVPDRLGHAWPVGLAQGKFRIARQGAAGKAVVRQELDGISFRTLSGGAARKPAAPVRLDGVSLEEFLARVRAQVRGEGIPDEPR